MQRVLTQLTDEQLGALRERSKVTGQPVAALIRAAVDAWLAHGERGVALERALAVVGAFRSGVGDLAEHHDRYLDDAE